MDSLLLEDTVFDYEEIDGRTVGAGIIPVAIHPDGNIYLLLGKERYVTHWRGSLKWSGFEGGRKLNENIERTAAREFIEESIGVVPLCGCDHLKSLENVENILLQKKYLFKITLCILHGNERSEKRYHVTFFVEVPYNTECTKIFQNTRKKISDFQQQFVNNEKFRDCLPRRYPFLFSNYIYNENKIRTICKVNKIDGYLIVEYQNHDNTLHILKEKVDDINLCDIEMYLKYFQNIKKIRKDIEETDDIPSKAINIDCNDYYNVSINEDFIEKQTIQWWCIDELEEVIKNGGYTNNEFFRAYFIPVLQRGVQELRSHINTNTLSV